MDGTIVKRRVRAAVVAAALTLAILPMTQGSAAETESFGFEPWPPSVAGTNRAGFELRLPPGGETSDQARIYNKTDQTRTYRVYGADVITDPASGNPTVSGANAEPTGVGSWLAIADDLRELELAPNGSRIIDLQFVRPADARTGGRGALVAEEITPAEGGGTINVRFRIALPIDATAGSVDEGLVVEELDLDVPLQFLPSMGTVTATIRNGDPDTITGNVQIHVDRGSRRFLLVQEAITLRPGERAEYVAEWTSVPMSGGSIEPGIELAWDGGNLRLDGDRVFVLPGWAPALLVLFVATLVLRQLRRQLGERRTGSSDGVDVAG